MPHKLPSIPDVPPDHDVKMFLDPMKETIEVWAGARKTGARKLDAVVSYQDLVDLGLITETQVPK